MTLSSESFDRNEDKVWHIVYTVLQISLSVLVTISVIASANGNM